MRTRWADDGWSDARPWLTFMRLWIMGPDERTKSYTDLNIDPDGTLSYLTEGVNTCGRRRPT